MFFFSLFLPFMQWGHKGQPYNDDAKVKNFIQWVKAKNDSGEVKNAVMDGYYPYPPVPEKFSKYSSSLKGTDEITSRLWLHAICMLYALSFSHLYSLIWVDQSVAILTVNNLIFIKI